MSLPRTSPPLQSKKRKVNDLESTEEDEPSVNRKTNFIRYMDSEPTQSATPSSSYRLFDHDHSIRMKAALPSQLPENNLAAVAAVNYNHPLHNIPVNQRQLTPQSQPQAHTQTPSHPQSQSQAQPQSRFQSQPPPQPPLRPQPQSQPQQSPRSIATPVAVPGSADTKKSTPKPAAKRTQIPGDGTLGTSTPSGTPVQATPQLAPQHLRTTNHPTSRPTSQSPHPTAVVNGSASTLGSSPRVAPSPALHAIAVAGTNAASISSPHGPHPPSQSAIQPQQGQPQPQPQAVPQARPPFPQQAKGFAPPLQTYMNMGAAGMNPTLYEQLAAQAQGRNAKGGVVGQSTQQQIYYMMQAQAAQAQAQAHAQGQVQPVILTPAQFQTQARYAAQMAQMQAVLAHMNDPLMEVVQAQAQAQGMTPTQMFIPMNPMNPQMLQQLQLMQQHAAQAQAGERVGGYPTHAWRQLQMSMNGMNGIAFRQGGGQPHASLTAAQAAQVKAAQQAHTQAQSQGAGAR